MQHIGMVTKNKKGGYVYMECKEFRKMLDSYVGLSDEKLVELSKHAAECKDCKSELDFYLSIVNCTSQMPIPAPPPKLIAEVNAKLDSAPKRTAKLKLRSSIGMYSKRYAAVAACLAVGLAVGLNTDTIKEQLDPSSSDGVISESVVTETSPVPTGGTAAEPSSSEAPVETASEAPAASPANDNTSPTAEQQVADSVASSKSNTDKGTSSGSKVTPAPTRKPIAASKSGSRSSSAAASSSGNVVSLTTPAPTRRPIERQPSASSSSASASSGSSYEEPEAEESASASEETPATESSSVTTPEASESLDLEQSDTGTTDASNSYAITRDGYHLPSRSTAASGSTEADSNGVDSYSLEGEGGTIARAVDSTDAPSSFITHAGDNYSSITVSGTDDAKKVAEIIIEMGIAYENGCYTASYDEFYSLISKIAAKGIQYDYSISDLTSDTISFKLCSPN